MSSIKIRNAQKDFSTTRVIHDLNLDITDGSFFSLLGASGCGKTTTLRAIAGLDHFTSGELFIADREVSHLPPAKRDIAFVFQLYSLYPHLSVHDNIGFPLRAVGTPAQQSKKRIAEVAELLQIQHLLKQKPGTLAGGDMQRVALARALVRTPHALLMDEPLGALDAQLREQLRGELKQLHKHRGTTTVYVTHDQSEAMAMSDSIAIMEQGVLQQVGSPSEIYNAPANTYVAQFIGAPAMNLIPALFTEQHGRSHLQIADTKDSIAIDSQTSKHCERCSNDQITLGIRPENIRISDTGIAAEVIHVERYGGYRIIETRVGTTPIRVRSANDIAPQIGESVHLSLGVQPPCLFDSETGMALGRRV